MNFAEALDNVNKGFRMRCTEWGSKRYFSRVDDTSDLNAIHKLDLEDINGEWVHYATDVASKDFASEDFASEDLSFYQAMEYMDMKYKIARRSWYGKLYFCKHIMYLQGGERLYGKEYICLSMDDLIAKDWVAMK